MPIDPRYDRPPSFRGGGGGGNSLANLIYQSGQDQADRQQRSSDAFSNSLLNAAQLLTGGLQQRKARKDEEKVQAAVQGAASGPQMDMDSEGNPISPRSVGLPDTIKSLRPELRGRATKAWQDWQESVGKRQETDLKLKELQGKITQAQEERQQKDLDIVAVGAHHGLQWQDQPDGGLGYAKQFLAQAKEAGIKGVDQYDGFLAGADDAWQAAQGDEKAMKTVADAIREQTTPIYQSFMSRGSATVQDKFKTETEKVEVVNPDGSKTIKLVEKKPGQTFESAAPPPNLQTKDTDKGIQTFDDPRKGTLGPVIGQPRPPAALIALGNAPKLSDAALDQAAEAFHGTGKMPPNLPRGAAGLARITEIMNRTAELHPDFNVAEALSAFESNKKSLDKLQQQTDAVAAFETTAGKNAELLEGVLKKLPDTGTSLLNKPLRGLSGVLGSEDIATFNAIRQSVQNEYSRIISSPTLSGTMSDSARKEGEAILKGDMTVGQLRAALKVLRAETANRHTSYQGQLDTIMGRIRGKKAGTTADPLGLR